MKRLLRIAAGLGLFIALCCSPLIPVSSAGDDWQPIDPADLALKDNPKAPGADAMILYRESFVDAQGSSTKEYLRIKIFTQAGTKHADVEIPFVRGFDDIKDIRARTIRPDGSIVNFEGKPFEKTVVKLGGFKYLAKAFTLPDVQPGCMIEYRYRDQFDPNIYINNEWTIQGELYTRLARFAIRPYGPAPLYFRSYRLPPDLKPERQRDGSYALEVRDLPGIEEEPYMPPQKSLQARVEFFYRSASEPEKETNEEFWKRIGKGWNAGIDEFVNKKGALSAEASHTVSPDDSAELKLQKLYARAQQIRNLSMEESKTEKEEKTEKIKNNANAEDVLKRGYGNSRQINYAFVGLARAAGFEASVVFVAARTSEPFRPSMHDPDQLDADLVYVHTATKDYFLDPGAHFYPFGYLPWMETATSGLRVGKDGAVLTETPDLHSADCTIVRNADVALDADGSVGGTLQIEFTNEAGAMRRHDDRAEDAAGRKKSLEDEIKGWLPSGSSFEITDLTNWDTIDQPLHVEGKVKIPGMGTSAGRRVLFPAEIFDSEYAKAFTSEKRTNSVYFNYPLELSDTVRFRLPSGYVADSIPAPVTMNPGPVSYDISVQKAGDLLEVKRHLVINGLAYPVKSYPAVRRFFSVVKTDDESQIVLETTASAKNN